MKRHRSVYISYQSRPSDYLPSCCETNSTRIAKVFDSGHSVPRFVRVVHTIKTLVSDREVSCKHYFLLHTNLDDHGHAMIKSLSE